MSLKFVAGDLFEALEQEKESVFVPHVCNDKGGFGSGFVVPLARRFPVVRVSYLGWFNNKDQYFTDVATTTAEFKQGEVQFVKVQDNVIIANMIAQTLGGVLPLSYENLETCMKHVCVYAMNHGSKIIAPAFGGGLAGGDFNKIVSMIEELWVKQGLDVTVYYLPDNMPNNWEPPQ